MHLVSPLPANQTALQTDATYMPPRRCFFRARRRVIDLGRFIALRPFRQQHINRASRVYSRGLYFGFSFSFCTWIILSTAGSFSRSHQPEGATEDELKSRHFRHSHGPESNTKSTQPIFPARRLILYPATHNERADEKSGRCHGDGNEAQKELPYGTHLTEL